jgi:hypothetical protein
MIQGLLLAALLAASAAAPVQESPDARIAAIQARLTAFAGLRGHFRQVKRIAVLHAPLISTGTFVLARGKGLSWRTETPFPSELRMTPSGIAQVEDGKAVPLLSGDAQRGAGAIARVMLGILSLDPKKLTEHFTVQSAEAPEGKPWRATLTPSDEGVAHFLERLTLTGDGMVQTITLVEANGDVTEIAFDALKAGPLSVKEAALFE